MPEPSRPRESGTKPSGSPEQSVGTDAIRIGQDGVARCWWPGDDPLYLAYHDEEWGVPVTDERRMIEMLVLESFQAGLSWLTILRRREGFRAALDGFDPQAIAEYGDADVARLMSDSRIIRNRAKILATIGNAQATLRLNQAGTSLVRLFQAAAPSGGREPPRTIADIPTTTPEATTLSKDLRTKGFKFLGPTVLYAHMQATGVVNDHVLGCAFRDRG